MLKITLIRNGKTEGNAKGQFIGATDEPLLDDERELLANLKFPHAGAVYCSPAQRCVATAKILFPYETQIKIPELAERNFGLFEGKTYKELTANPKYEEWIKNNTIVAYPQGEELSQFQARCLKGFEKTIREAVANKKSDIAIVTGAGPIMSIMYAYGFPKQEYSKWMVNNAEGYRIRLEAEYFEEGADESKRKIIVDGKLIRS